MGAGMHGRNISDLTVFIAIVTLIFSISHSCLVTLLSGLFGLTRWVYFSILTSVGEVGLNPETSPSKSICRKNNPKKLFFGIPSLCFRKMEEMLIIAF